MTYNELIYMVLDEIKLQSDDSYFNEDHVIFLLDKYRTFLLKQRYSDIKRQIPSDNFQTLSLTLEGNKSIESIPDIMLITIPRINIDNSNIDNITYTSKERLKYVGNNKYLKNIIYCTTNTDNKLIFTNIPKEETLSSITITAIFQDSVSASNLVKDRPEDLRNRIFPIENALVPNLIQLVVKDILGASYRPEDEKNDSKDELSDLANYLRRNLKSNTAKEIFD